METLHNALSLRQLDTFLEQMTTAPLFKTPTSSPPKYPSTPLMTAQQSLNNETAQSQLLEADAVVPVVSLDSLVEAIKLQLELQETDAIADDSMPAASSVD